MHRAYTKLRARTSAFRGFTQKTPSTCVRAGAHLSLSLSPIKQLLQILQFIVTAAAVTHIPRVIPIISRRDLDLLGISALTLSE